MEILGKLVLGFLAVMSLIAGIKLWFDGFQDLGAITVGTGLGLFGFIYWGLQQ